MPATPRSAVAGHVLRLAGRTAAAALLPWAVTAACLLAQAPPQEREARARALVNAGEPAEAVPLYEELLRAEPDNSALAVNLLVARFKANQYEEVIALARRLVGKQPELTAAWLFLGASELRLGRPAKAVAPLERVLAAQPGERNARLMLAESLLRLERFAEAAENFSRAAEALPGNPRVWYGLERSYHAMAKSEPGYERKADEAYARLAALPESSLLHEVNARRLDARLRHREAAEAWKKALALDPRNNALKHGLAASLFQARDLEASLALTREIAAAGAPSAAVQLLCGRILLDMQKPEEATPCLERAMAQDPDLPGAGATLGEAYVRTGRYRDAIPHLVAAAAGDADGSIHFQLGRAYQGAGEPQRAREAFVRSQQLRRKAEEERRQRSGVAVSEP